MSSTTNKPVEAVHLQAAKDFVAKIPGYFDELHCGEFYAADCAAALAQLIANQFTVRPYSLELEVLVDAACAKLDGLIEYKAGSLEDSRKEMLREMAWEAAVREGDRVKPVIDKACVWLDSKTEIYRVGVGRAQSEIDVILGDLVASFRKTLPLSKP